MYICVQVCIHDCWLQAGVTSNCELPGVDAGIMITNFLFSFLSFFFLSFLGEQGFTV